MANKVKQSKENLAIELVEVDKNFEVATEYIKVLTDINLKIEKGEFVIITGPSGSGKSTLLHIICGWEKPTDGSVFIGGNDIYKSSESERIKYLKTKMAVVSQTPSWIRSLNTVENIRLPYLLAGFPKHIATERANNLINMLELDELSTHNPADLSGGQQQRVNLLRALINNSEIIIADEPTGNLDSHSSRFVSNLLYQIHKDLNRTVVLATHDVTLLPLATRVIEILDGKIKTSSIKDKNFLSTEAKGDVTDISKHQFCVSEEGWLR